MLHLFDRKKRNNGKPKAIRRFFNLLLGIILLLTFIPNNSSSAQNLNSVYADDPTGMLIYKTFGDPETDLQPPPAPCEGENCDADSTAFYKPYSVGSLSSESRSDLIEVTSPQMWPFSPTVKIFSHWPAGTTTTCSGMMVEAKYVLTAAHCIYSHAPENCLEGESACWVDDIEAIPSYQDGDQPFGESGYQTILTWKDWTISQDTNFDLAAIQLRYPIGASIGWLGVGFNNDDSYFTNNVLSSSSYPEDPPYDGERMYVWNGMVDDAVSSDEILYLNHDSDSGQMGGTLNGENGVAYGVYSLDIADTQTGVTRITYAKFDSIRTFIQEGQPKSDLDLTAFDVQAKPKWNFPGHKLTDVNVFIQNYSTTDIPFGCYQIDIYLSPDNLISESDTLLNSFTYESAFGPNQGVRVAVPPETELWLPNVIHGSEPNGGTFYVGVIVQSLDGEVNTENNRSDYYQPEPIWVNDSNNSNYVFPLWVR
jgi:V8-like Glu-specific endopeptidase